MSSGQTKSQDTKAEDTSRPGRSGLLGSLADLRRDPLGTFLQFAQDHGDVVDIRVGPRRITLVTHPEDIKHILVKNHKNYGKQTRSFRALRHFLGQGLLTSEGASWLRQRRIAAPAFHRERVSALSNKMSAATEAMLREWDTKQPKGLPVEMHGEMNYLALKIAGDTLLSTDITDTADGIGQSLDVLLRYTQKSLTRFTGVPLAVPTPRNRRVLAARHTLEKVIDQIIDDRRNGKEPSADLLTMLMEARDEDGESMTSRQLRDEMVTMLIAGHETTANGLTWVWYLLSRNPVIAQRVHNEVDTVLEGRTPTANDLLRLSYTTCVIKETMRLFPPVWMISRNAIEADRLREHKIPKGRIVVMSPYVTHRREDLWTDSGRFNPDRFSNEDESQRDRFAYFPFGGGPRQCIGNGFAMMEMQLIVAMVMQRFELIFAGNGEVKPEPLVTLRPESPVLVQLRRRHYF